MRHLFNNPRQLVIINIVLRLDPVAGPVGSILFFFKSKQRRFSKKITKVNRFATGSPGQPAGLAGSHRFFLSPFFLQPGRVPAPGLPGPGSTRRVGSGFKTMIIRIQFNNPMQC